MDVGMIPFIPFLNGVSMVLKFGDGKSTGKQAQVVQLQKVLQTLGFSPGTIDGEYGNKTSSAVANFQNIYGLNPTGQTDEITFTTMRKALTGEIAKKSVVAPIIQLAPQPSLLDSEYFGVSAKYWLIGLGVIITISYILRK